MNKPCCAPNAKPSTPRARGRLALAVPESEALLERAFAAGRIGRQSNRTTAPTCWTCTARPLCAAPFGKRWNGIRRAPPRSPSCCAGSIAPRRCRRWISAAIRRRRRWMSAPTIWRLTMNSPTRATTTPSNSLPAQLEQIGLRALASEVDDFLARATKAALVSAPDPGTSGADRNRRTRPPQSGTAAAPLRDQEVQAHGRLRLVLAHQDRTRRH